LIISWGILPDGIVPLIDLGDLHEGTDLPQEIEPPEATTFEQEMEAEEELEETISD